ncbi:hypothetical protein [Flavobacterium sp. 7A]|uniref:hypothetical protein n=1 Tax=Flavobacterium sp. 7A TaxID=2940571 RepID=UPI002225F1FA|nr:hypothetical protein [Flavobacterium sp. 7A]MCW2119915.1 hypothetical protein [Flavobacterium sp. 7A]
MKTYIINSKKASFFMLFSLSTFLLTSCGSFENSSYYESDGIYGGSTAPRNEVTQRNYQSNEYKEYFKSLQTDPQSDQIFTDVESYNSYDDTQNTNNQYAGWGNNHPQTNVNIYPNNNWGMGMYNGYNSPFYGWGYGGGYGWNSPFYGYNNFGWGYSGFGYGYNNFGWNSPYYGYGYGGYGNGFNNGYYYNNNNSYNRVRSSSYNGRSTSNSLDSRSYNNNTNSYSRSAANGNSSRSNSIYTPSEAPVFSRNSTPTSGRRYTTPPNNSNRGTNTATRTYNNTESNTTRSQQYSTPSRSYSNDSYSRPSNTGSYGGGSYGGSYGGSSGGSSGSGRRGR